MKPRTNQRQNIYEIGYISAAGNPEIREQKGYNAHDVSTKFTSLHPHCKIQEVEWISADKPKRAKRRHGRILGKRIK